MSQPSIEQAALAAPLREQFEIFLDEHRNRLALTLSGLTEEEARASLVPSRTTLLGLVKHCTTVELVWFDGAITGRSRSELGVAETVEGTFILTDDDTIDSVTRGFLDACAASRRATASMGLDDVLPHHRLGPLPLHWAYLHLLRELAQHLGHADILREQIVNRRTS